jgi:hypothetical protein
MAKKTLIIISVIIFILIIIGISIYLLTKKNNNNNDLSDNKTSKKKSSKNDLSKNDLSKNDLSKNDLSKNDLSNNDLSNNDLSNNDLSKNNLSNNIDKLSIPSGISNPPISKWQPVKNRGTDDNMVWSGKIYDAMSGDIIGTRKAPYEGGVGYNTGFLGTTNELTKDMADNLCGNPCYWYYNLQVDPNASQEEKNKFNENIKKNKDKINNAALCDCSTSKSKNF